MVLFPHFVSFKCLSSYYKYFDMKKNTVFHISDKISIPVSFYKTNTFACICTEAKYAITFMKFIVKKFKREELFCEDKHLSTDYYEYFEYILTCNMIHHIKYFIKKYYPIVMKSYKHDNVYEKFNRIYNTIAKETLMKNTLSLTFDLFSLYTISTCIDIGIGKPNAECLVKKNNPDIFYPIKRIGSIIIKPDEILDFKILKNY
ncbi:hypothetical protein ma844 [Moumouvirus australiensis]|uniref:Uncharacterized protein n=1 Tax=Moumouvirus australiensis TaxID=2109587 RepID=A0A2P1EMX1_9VIRU|nr:hypothetical protein QKC55_gp060 [Moumouvirus australiensis]AVL95231.1 hypothetical protein ma844 [Moumouvirus australiensis]